MNSTEFNEMNKANYRQALIDKIKVPVEQCEVVVGSVKTAYLSARNGPPVICLHALSFISSKVFPSGVVCLQYRCDSLSNA